MIVVDSSVWIANLRGLDTPQVRKLEAIEDSRGIVVGDLVLLEVLRGARDEGHATRLERNLRRFRIESMLNEAVAVRAARVYRLLRARGVTIRKTADLVIATFCLVRGYSLLHADRDFDTLAAHMGLQIA